MAIDMHSHWVPPVIAAALRARTAAPRVIKDAKGEEWLDFGASFPIRLPEGFDDDIDTRLRRMDEVGISHGLLSLVTTCRIEWLPIDESLRLCRAFNDAVSAACTRWPERFSALAILPARDAQVALDEFRRAMTLPGMVGALLLGDAFLSLRRAEFYRPVLAEADARHAIVFVHYGQLPDDPDAPVVDTSDSAYVRIVTLDFQARLSSTMVTLCLTDLLKDYPHITALSHNLGGNIAFEIERMDHRAITETGAVDELPSARFRQANVLVDCNSFGPRAIELAVTAFGQDKVVFGTDGSMFGAKWSMDAVAAARMPENARQAILEGNARAALSRVIR